MPPLLTFFICCLLYLGGLTIPQGLMAGAVAAVTGAVVPYGYPAYAGYAAAPVAVPASYAGVPVAHGLGLPEAATFLAPPVRAVAEAPIVEQVYAANCLMF